MPAHHRRPLFILGMHHSGTKMVARALHDAGALSPQSGRDQDASAVNQSLLNEAGGSWWQPPSRSALYQVLATAFPELTAGKLIADLKDKTGRGVFPASLFRARPWLMEDPAFCLTLPWWLSRFPQAKIVWVQRNPAAIVESLLSRKGPEEPELTAESAMALVEHYDAAALRSVKTTGATFLTVHYEALTSPDPAERSRAWKQLSAYAGVEQARSPVINTATSQQDLPCRTPERDEGQSLPARADENPLVSVIVPNYNHAPYLDERIGSIVNQTYRNIEILLMDDLSPDDSRERLEEWARRDDRISLKFNTTNSGSPFHQWDLGARWAKGKYIWIAESDDAAEVDMLETHVAALERNDKAVIAYSQSQIIDENSEYVSNWNVNYERLFGSALHWQRRFTVSGVTEVAERMIFSNTIPNASGALIRKSAFDRAGIPETSWKLNGDWLFYSRLLQLGDIEYFPQERNRFRQHRETQRNRGNKNSRGFFEVLALLQIYETENWADDDMLLAARRQVCSWWINSIFHMMPNRQNISDNIRLYREFARYDPDIRAKLAGTFVKKCGRWARAPLVKLRDNA